MRYLIHSGEYSIGRCKGQVNMANGDQLRKLFQSYQHRDDQAFVQFAQQIITEEREKHHNLLANDLEHALNGGHGTRSRKVLPTLGMRRLDELPHDRERDNALLDVRYPSRGFADILLSDDDRRSIEEIIREHRKIEILSTHGLAPRRKLLFCGPPGCGKTLCAEVIAHELELPLLYGRFDAIISSFLGETAANLRKVFEYANRGTWVLFFDEFDAIGKSRDDASEHGELKRVINSFLQLLDNFGGDSLVIAATNHQTLLDVALWRRFDEVLYFGRPDETQILPLLELKLASIRHASIDLHWFVPHLTGMTHADIERICQDAMRIDLLDGRRELTRGALQRALNRHQRRLAVVMATAEIPSPKIGDGY